MPSVTWDRGHGLPPIGKQSPNGILKEWEWCDDFVRIACQTIQAKGIHCVNIVPEQEDISLDERVRRINAVTREFPDNIHLSIHINAAGRGDQWYNARGWQVHTYTNPSVGSRRLACLAYEGAVAHNFKVRPESPGMPFRPKNLKILRETTCPAILIENFFMDNKDDLAYLLTPLSIYECAEVATSAVLKYFELYG